MTTAVVYSIEPALMQVPVEEIKGFVTAKEHDKHPTDMLLVVRNEDCLAVDRFTSLSSVEIAYRIHSRIASPYSCRWTFTIPLFSPDRATKPFAVLFQADSTRYCLNVPDTLGFARAKKMGTTECLLIYFDERGINVQGPVDWTTMLSKLKPAL